MALDDDIALLARVPVLGGMGREALRLLAFAAETRQLRTGDVLFRKDDTSDSGYVVAMGTVAMLDEGGQDAALVGPGALIGELALISETRRPATAVAREPTTVLRISRPMFRRTLEEYPQVAQRLAGALRERVLGMSKDLSAVRRRLTDLDE
ncbi:cyclic nucleotide-binding domain-containing protein [Labrys wisconsinensis]|uniref:CRP-like cAMP-binding protein n=1 Tax=Labrys wisconsinensis TaxID=425677 RepID=A0ABU0JK32_9HYPH|nr:cyclic nucleotide-binding domain-containing protein [Labrys wisconsinensis]MDQ0474656.1 CRP-like cAMP-binding protein [Labrys wisconsinensis]